MRELLLRIPLSLRESRRAPRYRAMSGTLGHPTLGSAARAGVSTETRKVGTDDWHRASTDTRSVANRARRWAEGATRPSLIPDAAVCRIMGLPALVWPSSKLWNALRPLPMLPRFHDPCFSCLTPSARLNQSPEHSRPLPRPSTIPPLAGLPVRRCTEVRTPQYSTEHGCDLLLVPHYT